MQATSAANKVCWDIFLLEVGLVVFTKTSGMCGAGVFCMLHYVYIVFSCVPHCVCSVFSCMLHSVCSAFSGILCGV